MHLLVNDANTNDQRTRGTECRWNGGVYLLDRGRFIGDLRVAFVILEIRLRGSNLPVHSGPGGRMGGS